MYESEVLKLTEREVFCSLRQQKDASHQCFLQRSNNITVEEDGLSGIFSTAARAQSCPSPLPDQAQIAALACKFTLLPAQGSYGERQKDIRA